MPVSKVRTKTLTIGYVGSFRKVHLVLDLLQASKNLNIAFLLIGDGSEKTIIESYVKENNMTNVDFLGSKEQSELIQYFAECDVMWAATNDKHWGIPIKCFEYLACNKKVIYTKKEDFVFIEKNNYGYGLDTTDVESIQNLLKRIMLDYDNGILEDNKNSRDYIVQHNDWHTFSKVIIEDINSDN